MASTQDLLEATRELLLLGSSDEPALITAAKAGREPMIRLLITKKGDSPDVRDKNQCAPLHHAAQAGHIDAAEALISLGANVSVGDAHRNTPLHEACRFRKLPMARLLVQKGADVNLRNDIGETPLHFAIRSRDAKLITFLMQRGADPNRAAKEPGNTPMDLARVTSPALCEMIANYGASPSPSRRKKPMSRLNLGSLPRSKSIGDVLGHSRLLNDSTFSDVVFNFKDGRLLHAHYFVLRCRAPGFCKLFPKKERRKHRDQTVQVDLKNDHILSYHSMKAILRYVYTGQVNLVQMQDRHTTSVLSLWHAALQYDLNELAFLCEAHHNSFLSMANIYMLLKFAEPLHEPKIMRSCLEFAAQHKIEFMENKAETTQLGTDLLAAFMGHNVNAYKPPTPVTEKETQDNLREDFRKIFEQAVELRSDPWATSFVLLGKHKVFFHKAILAAQSGTLARSLSRSHKEEDLTAFLDVANYYGGSNVVHPSGNISSRDHAQKPQVTLTRASSVSALISPRNREGVASEPAASETGRIPLQRLKPVSAPVLVLTALLRYFYYRCVDIEPLIAIDLLRLCDMFELSELSSVCKSIVSKNVNPTTVLPIFALLETDINMESRGLKSKCYSCVAKNLAKVNFLNANISHETAMDVLLAVQVQAQSTSGSHIAHDKKHSKKHHEKKHHRRHHSKGSKVEAGDEVSTEDDAKASHSNEPASTADNASTSSSAADIAAEDDSPRKSDDDRENEADADDADAAQLGAMQAKLVASEQKISSLESVVEELQATVSELAQKNERLEETLMTHRKELFSSVVQICRAAGENALPPNRSTQLQEIIKETLDEVVGFAKRKQWDLFSKGVLETISYVRVVASMVASKGATELAARIQKQAKIFVQVGKQCAKPPFEDSQLDEFSQCGAETLDLICKVLEKL
eukprot:CAMPEP_0174232798 /NCGR_PEP_ID=MMETSP0417-20130205/2985_1 /TAXON_ID=242541 /ORGANISM="Mayorella sp, Strain BSH-02190019" /LENGTH=919 /DNA_ID=CAMNT_0015310905 /DNA_START=33 /DNA_END=2792 /DNA_ORIENTATION=+